MSSSDSFKDRLKRTQSNIWKSANKLFGRNVSGGGVEDFVSGGGIMADFPSVGKGKGARTSNYHVKLYMDSTGKGYDEFVRHYREEVTEGGKPVELFKSEIEQFAATGARGTRSPSPSRAPRQGASPVQAPLRAPVSPMSNLQLPQNAAWQSGPPSASSSGASRGRSRGNSFASPQQMPQGQQGKWSRKSPVRSEAARQAEAANYAMYKAQILAEDPTKPSNKIREDYLKHKKETRKVMIDGKSYPKPPVHRPRGPNAKKSPLKTVIDREYSTPVAPGQKRNKNKVGDIFLKKNPQYRGLGGEDRFAAFMNDVYYKSAEYADVQQRKAAEAARPKKYNLWQSAIRRDYNGANPRPSFKAFKGAEAGSPERMAYEALYDQPKKAIRRVWEQSPEYRDFNQGGRDVNRFFRNR